MDKENGIHICKEILFNYKSWKPAICNNMDETTIHYIKWKKLSPRDKCRVVLLIGGSLKASVSWKLKIVQGGVGTAGCELAAYKHSRAMGRRSKCCCLWNHRMSTVNSSYCVLKAATREFWICSRKKNDKNLRWQMC